MPKLFSNPALRRRKINAVRPLAFVVALILLSATRAVGADSAPDWLRAAAKEALPAYPDDPIAVMLLNETFTTVNPSGEVETRYRMAVKILRPQGKDKYGFAGAQFDNETRISSFKGWTITADGHELALSDKDTVETSLSTYEIFSDDRAKLLKFSAADPGSVVGYEYTQKARPLYFEDAWPLQYEIPNHRARIILQLPGGWEYSTKWFNHDEPAPQHPAPNQTSWEVTDIPSIKTEPDMPPTEAVAAYIGVKYFPSDVAMRPKSVGSWSDIGVWVGGMVANSNAPSPAITQKVNELTQGITDPAEKIKTLAAYVQHQIRYAAVEIGIGGMQPHPAADVFARQYGDCKDKATLLNAMLHVAGIDAYNVMVDTDRGVVRPDYPSLHFDHEIIAIRLPEGASDAGFFAIVNDTNLGRLLLFDPTNEYVPIGYLPSYLQENYGLVLGTNGGKLISTPLVPPVSNRLLRQATLTLTSAGDLQGEVKEMRWGEPAQSEREQFMETQPSKRAEVFENYLGDFLSNFRLTGASIGNLDKYDSTLSLDYTFGSQGYARMAGDELLVRPRVLGDKYTSFLDLFTQAKPRQYPIEFKVATRQDDVFDIQMPTGYELDGAPPPVNFSCDFGTYTSKVAATAGVLHYTRTLQLTDIVVPKEKLAQVKDFLQKIAADQEMFVALKPVESQASAPKPAN